MSRNKDREKTNTLSAAMRIGASLSILAIATLLIFYISALQHPLLPYVKIPPSMKTINHIFVQEPEKLKFSSKGLFLISQMLLSVVLTFLLIFIVMRIKFRITPKAKALEKESLVRIAGSALAAMSLAILYLYLRFLRYVMYKITGMDMDYGQTFIFYCMFVGAVMGSIFYSGASVYTILLTLLLNPIIGILLTFSLLVIPTDLLLIVPVILVLLPFILWMDTIPCVSRRKLDQEELTFYDARFVSERDQKTLYLPLLRILGIGDGYLMDESAILMGLSIGTGFVGIFTTSVSIATGVSYLPSLIPVIYSCSSVIAAFMEVYGFRHTGMLDIKRIFQWIITLLSVALNIIAFWMISIYFGIILDEYFGLALHEIIQPVLAHILLIVLMPILIFVRIQQETQREEQNMTGRMDLILLLIYIVFFVAVVLDFLRHSGYI